MQLPLGPAENFGKKFFFSNLAPKFNSIPLPKNVFAFNSLIATFRRNKVVSKEQFLLRRKFELVYTNSTLTLSTVALRGRQDTQHNDKVIARLSIMKSRTTTLSK
jgi:hypothetical protein